MRKGECLMCGACCQGFILYRNMRVLMGDKPDDVAWVINQFPFLRHISTDEMGAARFTCAALGANETIDGRRVRLCTLHGQALKPGFCDIFPEFQSNIKPGHLCGYHFERVEAELDQYEKA